MARRPSAALSAGDARRMALRAQGLLGAARRPADPAAVLRQVTALQLDTISVLARSHELVCYARLGPVGRPAVERACWGTDPAGDPVAVEYWAHAACILPVESWPWFAFRRRANRVRTSWWHETDAAAMARVRARLEADGPLTAADLGGAKQDGVWWDWAPGKVAVERLLAYGEVVCTTRRGWRRVYDLAERGLPAAVLAAGEPDDGTCLTALVARAGAALGVATVADLADHFRLLQAQVAGVVADSGLVAVEVAGWDAPAWADPAALDQLGERGRHRATLLSPFDSLVWDRARTARLFGFTHRLEAYTPVAKRVHGYYAMPVLAGGRLVGRVDPKRDGATLVVRRVSLAVTPSARMVADLAAALREAAAWVGCSAVVVETAHPDRLGPALAAALH